MDIMKLIRWAYSRILEKSILTLKNKILLLRTARSFMFDQAKSLRSFLTLLDSLDSEKHEEEPVEIALFLKDGGKVTLSVQVVAGSKKPKLILVKDEG